MRRLTAVGGLLLSLTLVVAAGALENQLLLPQTQWQREMNFINQTNYQRNSTDPAQSIPADDGKIRILAVGDSFIWGDGVANMDETWPRVLESTLNDAAGSEIFDVIDIGQNGASTFNQLEWFNDGKLLTDNSIDAVIMGYVTNDPVPPGSESSVCDGYWCYGIRQAEAQPLFQDCVSGVSGFVPTSLSALASLAAPLAQDLANKYCRSTAATLPPSDESGYFYADWLTRITQPDSLRTYADTAGRLSALLGDIPGFVIPTPVVLDDLERATKPLAVLEDAGMTVVPLDATIAMLTNPGDAQLWVSPMNSANPHPGLALTEAYAADIVAVLREDPRIARLIDEATPSAATSGIALTNSIPAVRTFTDSRGVWSAAFTGDARATVDTALTALGHTYPVQRSLCMKHGAPYATIGTSRIDGSVTVTMVDGDSTEWELKPIPSFGAATPTVTAVADGWSVSGGPIRGFDLVFTSDAGCSIDSIIELPRFAVTVREEG